MSKIFLKCQKGPVYLVKGPANEQKRPLNTLAHLSALMMRRTDLRRPKSRNTRKVRMSLSTVKFAIAFEKSDTRLTAYSREHARTHTDMHNARMVRPVSLYCP